MLIYLRLVILPLFFFPKLITAVVMKNWKEIVESCDLKNWREALAAVLTYAKPDEFSALCGKKWALYLLHVHDIIIVVNIKYKCYCKFFKFVMIKLTNISATNKKSLHFSVFVKIINISSLIVKV